MHSSSSDDAYFLWQAGKADFEMLEKKAMEWEELKVPSAKQVISSSYFISKLHTEYWRGTFVPKATLLALFLHFLED